MSEQHSSISSQNYGKISRWLRFCRWLWKYPLPFLVSTILINVVINIGSNALITSSDTKAIPATSLIGRLTEWVGTHWLTTLLFAAFSIALLLVTWRGNREPKSASSVPKEVQMSTRDRERLLKRLRVRYEQLLAQSLQGAIEIELGLTSRPAAIHNAVSLSLRLPEQPEQALPAHTSIIDAYNLAQQELLILGEPGAGKSTLLLELAHHLVTQAEQDMVQPLPVVLPLSSWATKRLPLQDWLIEQFALLYDVPRQLSHDWMQAGLILPLLDGLDEIEESARPACIAAINTYHQEHLQPLVVCSRTNEYDTAAQHERIALHTAIVVQPLTREQIDAHLATVGKPLAALRTTLKKNTTLQTLATTPLLLQILMLTYHDISVRVLSLKEDQLREQIWSDYVQQMVRRKGDITCYPLERTCAWLSWLAREMRLHNQTIFSLERLQPNWLPKRRRTIYQWNVGLTIGLLSCLVCWLLAEPIDGQPLTPLIALLCGLFIGLYFERDTTIKPTEALTWSWKGKNLSKGLRHGLLFGLIGGLIGGLLLGLINGPIDGRVRHLLEWLFGGMFGGQFVGLLGRLVGKLVSKLLDGQLGWLVFALLWGLVIGLFVGLLCGLIFGLVSGLSGKQLTEHLMLSPNEGIRRSIKNGLLAGLLSTLSFGLFGGLLAGLVFGLPDWTLAWLLLGLLGGLLGGLIFGLGAVLQHYLLRFWLWRSRLFPLKAVPFLEDATARILLRRVGGGYSFTHRLLLDYFADLQTTTPAPSPGSHPTPPPPPP
jgi:GTPase SAR1 family protein